MDIFTAIEQRRAVKKFDPDHRLTDQEIERLMRAAILSPNVTHIGIGVHTGSGGPWWCQDFFVRLP